MQSKTEPTPAQLASFAVELYRLGFAIMKNTGDLSFAHLEKKDRALVLLHALQLLAAKADLVREEMPAAALERLFAITMAGAAQELSENQETERESSE